MFSNACGQRNQGKSEDTSESHTIAHFKSLKERYTWSDSFKPSCLCGDMHRVPDYSEKISGLTAQERLGTVELLATLYCNNASSYISREKIELQLSATSRTAHSSFAA